MVFSATLVMIICMALIIGERLWWSARPRLVSLCVEVGVHGCSMLSTSMAQERSSSERFAPRDLEGIVGKRKNGLYRDDRPDWIKIKCGAYSQADGRHELLTQRRSN
jgi:hypothetical protein